jgi:hypothetical protein
MREVVRLHNNRAGAASSQRTHHSASSDVLGPGAASSIIARRDDKDSNVPVFGNDARQVIAFGAGRYAFMSARSMVKLDTNAGKPSLKPLHWGRLC